MTPQTKVFLLSMLSFSLLNQPLVAADYSSNWTATQIKSANTADTVSYLTTVEKETILFINLARMYPKQFAEYELKNYFGTARYGDYIKDSPYRKTLQQTLIKQKALKPLIPNKIMTDDAACFAKEIGDAGLMTHERKICPKNAYAECCSFGMNTGKDIAMQFLIDHNVSSLGHRKICLTEGYNKIGVSLKPHAKWNECCVLEII